MKAFFGYLGYVLRHKWYVFIECCKLGIPFLGLVHDMSKFRPSEFFPYMYNFYTIIPESDKEKRNNDFKKAWLLHLKRNKHHRQYWILNNDSGKVECLPIPKKYLKEMVADWIGAGKAITGKSDLANWFSKNEKMIINQLHHNSINHLYSLLYTFGIERGEEV
jgi:hypothetical protein